MKKEENFLCLQRFNVCSFHEKEKSHTTNEMLVFGVHNKFVVEPIKKMIYKELTPFPIVKEQWTPV